MAGKRHTITQIGPTCFEHGQLWSRLQMHGIPTQTVLVVPRKQGPELVKEAHGQKQTFHDGIQTTLILVLSVRHHAPSIDTLNTML
jgi:hypothetical protein